MNRRDLIQRILAASVVASLPSTLFATPPRTDATLARWKARCVFSHEYLVFEQWITVQKSSGDNVQLSDENLYEFSLEPEQRYVAIRFSGYDQREQIRLLKVAVGAIERDSGLSCPWSIDTLRTMPGGLMALGVDIVYVNGREVYRG